MAENEPYNLENDRKKLGKELLDAFDTLAGDALYRAGLPSDIPWKNISFEKISSFEGLRTSEELQIGHSLDNHYVSHEVQIGRPHEGLHESFSSLIMDEDGVPEDEGNNEDMPTSNFITLMQGFHGSRAVIEISAPAQEQ